MLKQHGLGKAESMARIESSTLISSAGFLTNVLDARPNTCLWCWSLKAEKSRQANEHVTSTYQCLATNQYYRTADSELFKNAW